MKIISVLTLCILFIGTESKTKKSKSVTTLLEAKWSVTPLVLEVAEYLADENYQLYWDFIDAICDLNPPLNEIGLFFFLLKSRCFIRAVLENDKEQYNAIMNEAAKLVSVSKLALLKFGVALHIYSPKIEMFGQIAAEKVLPNCPVIVELAGNLVCDIKEIKNSIENVI